MTRTPKGLLQAYLAAARITTALLGVVQLSALARWLPTEEYAAVAAAIAAAAYVQLAGEPAILGYERVGHHSRTSDSLPTGTRSVASATLLCLWGVVAIAGLVWSLARGDSWLALGIALWAVSLMQLRWVSVQYLNWGDNARYATSTLVNAVSRTACMLAAALASGQADVVLVLGSLGSIAATALVSPSPWPFSLGRAGLKALLRVGLPLTLASAARTSLAAWPLLAGARGLSAQSFASFAAQASLSGAAWGATMGFVLLFGFPHAKRLWDTGDEKGSLAVIERYSRYLLAAGPAIIGIWLVVGQWVTALLLGAEFSGTAVPVWMTALGGLAGIATVMSWDVRLRYAQNALASATISAAVIQIPLVWLLTDLQGLAGLMAAAATVQLALTLFGIRLSRGPSRALCVGLSALLWLVAMTAAFTALPPAS